MAFSENAVRILKERYLNRDKDGNVIETVDELFHRVADTIASCETEDESYANAFYQMMMEQKFMPNSPTLMNAGRPLGQLSACFVLPIEDSMEGIFKTYHHMGIIHKSGGGTGFSFSRIRPKDSIVKSTGGKASGPVATMKMYNAGTDYVKQGGMRRGANMAILRVDHPDILEFIHCKDDKTQLTNFNISVGLTEKFMEAVYEDEEYDLVDPHTDLIVGKLKARYVFDEIVNAAWTSGEPGIIFLDRVNADNIVPDIGEIEATNPCGEQPLLPYEACNLGSINLSKFVNEKSVDFVELGRVVRLAVRFLDDVIEVNRYPLPAIDEMTRATRKIGLGVMGLADMLYLLEIPYDSIEGVKTAEAVMQFIDDTAYDESCRLAETRGAYPLFSNSKELRINRYSSTPVRNGTRTTVAPTGTISVICGASSGIEPLFALAFMRNVMDNTKLPEVNPIFVEAMKQAGLYSDELMRKVAEAGTAAHIDEIPEHIRRVFVTAHDISPEWHIKMQAAIQRHTDNAVSKTVNFVNSATREEVAEVFKKAYELGCKGVTVYRDGCRDNQVLNIGDGKKSDAVTTAKPRKRAQVVAGTTTAYKIGCGTLFVTVNRDDRGICEVFTHLGKAGGCPSQSEATARLISIALRSGVDIEEIIHQLKGIKCPTTVMAKMKNPDIQVISCPDAIGRAIESAYNEVTAVTAHEAFEEAAVENSSRLTACPECGENSVIATEGCRTCTSCGWSKCS